MDNNLYDHIANRVKEIGYSRFHVQPIRFRTKISKRVYHIPAYNEMFFPVSEIPANVRIYSDTEIVNPGTLTSEQIRSYSELTGNIIIELPVGAVHLFEFIRVIPE